MTKNIKIEITPINNKQFIYKELYNLRKVSMQACNLASSYQFNDMMSKQESLCKIDYKITFGAFVENKMKEIMAGYNTMNVAQTRAFVFSKANYNPIDIKNGTKSLSTYKLSNPIIIHNKAYVIYDNNNDWFVDISLFNREKQKEYDVKRVEFKIVKAYTSSIPILTRLLNNEYKQGSGQITYDERKKKWFFGISYTFEPEKDNQLDANKVLGIDLGINKVAVFSIYDITSEQYQFLKYKECMMSGDELITFRQRTEAKKQSMQSATKWSSYNKTGHGTKHRMSDANKIGNKCANFRDTFNHKVSRYLVDEAVKYNCGIIQMENLSGYSKEQTDRMLKNWSYYDLQSKIKYKAEEAGIEFKLINPRYTSKRCSVCGKIHNLNRDCKKDQAKFECVFCGNKMNADINASRNIALPNIEELITEEVSKNELNKVI